MGAVQPCCQQCQRRSTELLLEGKDSLWALAGDSDEALCLGGTTPLAAATPMRPSADFAIVLAKSAYQSTLGVDVNMEDGHIMLITGVCSTGLMVDWNGMNPQYRVEEGDRIVEVNGIRGDTKKMIDRAVEDPILHIRICPRGCELSKEFESMTSMTGWWQSGSGLSRQ